MINNLQLFLKSANALLAALTEYDEATDRLCKVNLEVEEQEFAIDDIESIIQEREEIKERAEVARIAMNQTITEQSDEDVRLIREVFKGEEITYSLSGDKRLAKDVIYKLLSMQKDIMEKDTTVISKLRIKHEEIKATLKNLQGDRKRLDFLNLTATAPQDSGFNV